MNDRKAFDEFVYTDVDQAIKELHQRQQDSGLKKKVECFFKKVGIPEPFLDPKGRLVLFRQVATPNFENLRFLAASDGFGVSNLFLEYFEDKFTTNSPMKLALARLSFYLGYKKKNLEKRNINVIDFHKFDGKKISEVETLWGQSLVDFHHKIFQLHSKHTQPNFFDISPWLNIVGKKPEQYYNYVMNLFVQNNILFENFCLTGKEKRFTDQVFLLNFIKTKNLFKLKPLVVALEPTDIEGENFWFCYNDDIFNHIESIKNARIN